MKRKILFFICFILLCAGAMSACREELLLQGTTEEQVLDSEESDSAKENGMVLPADSVTLLSPQVIYVHVCGAVKEPGVYELKEGDRIHDAVNLAGGFDEEADTDAVNLVSVVSDGEQVRIPFIGEGIKISEDGLININAADVDELCEIPGIGESRAKAIVDYRKEHGGFANTEELMQVPGIKEGIYARIIPYIECR